MNLYASCTSRRMGPSGQRLCSIAAAVAIAALTSCTTAQQVKPVVAPTPVAPTTPATHPLTSDEPQFLRLPNTADGKTPTRIGMLLPFTNGSGKTRALAAAMLKAAQLAVF